MVEDIAYNSDLQTEYDDVGDIATVEDQQAVEQAVITAIIERTPSGALTPTPTQIEQRRSAIESAVESVTFSEPPVRVTVEDITETDGTATVAYRVETNRIAFTLQQ